ncbi:class I SAM-dependent methyltransferase [Phytomonospora endophytica]|uniref:Ubiquinone/menaquinone biosynthesis C-methylase UbiE n=1 Tax=Phytomonospora endophytica TaxID=714109 RepID=A0A841FVZ6_9ACTN|nr:methyltransferase domain-containing protein [Phytomonospora endophytica]MBB6037908.1 ubiquinone/menaquinone biosynthesis C-methylase UbiE [Phytomonospora endophytica]GIG68808.1 hypothetical protein Pen01_51030 [Phytomonospora endophytica]
MDALVDYRLGSSAAERDRLLAQCRLFRTCATQMLDRIDLPDAARALDVGCGPLGILDLLSRKVGETGTVAGLDTDPRMITWARQAVTEYGLGNVGLLHGPLSPQVVPDASCDLVHCRLVLVNNTGPE